MKTQGYLDFFHTFLKVFFIVKLPIATQTTVLGHLQYKQVSQSFSETVNQCQVSQSVSELISQSAILKNM